MCVSSLTGSKAIEKQRDSLKGDMRVYWILYCRAQTTMRIRIHTKLEEVPSQRVYFFYILTHIDNGYGEEMRRKEPGIDDDAARVRARSNTLAAEANKYERTR